MGQRLQDYFGDFGKLCFGSGADNEQGIQLNTYQEGDEGVTRIVPPQHLQGWPGIMQGGAISVLMDCTITSLAYATACRKAGLAAGDPATPTYVTVNFTVDFLKPTPVSKQVELRSRVEESDQRKMILACSLRADGEETARGRAVMVRLRQPGP